MKKVAKGMLLVSVLAAAAVCFLVVKNNRNQ